MKKWWYFQDFLTQRFPKFKLFQSENSMTAARSLNHCKIGKIARLFHWESGCSDDWSLQLWKMLFSEIITRIGNWAFRNLRKLFTTLGKQVHVAKWTKWQLKLLFSVKIDGYWKKSKRTWKQNSDGSMILNKSLSL